MQQIRAAAVTWLGEGRLRIAAEWETPANADGVAAELRALPEQIAALSPDDDELGRFAVLLGDAKVEVDGARLTVELALSGLDPTRVLAPLLQLDFLW